jgi:type IV pilus assembly protein PilW
MAWRSTPQPAPPARRIVGGARARQPGFTLLELMIGVAIGLLAALVVASVLLVSESQRRTVTSASDAQVSGALSLYSLQREVQAAGYGLVPSLGSLGCEVRAWRNGATFTWTLAPVRITDGANGAPDAITVFGSATDRYATPVRVVSNHPAAATEFSSSTTMGLAEGDLMIAVPPTFDANNWCSVFNVTGIGSAGGLGQIAHASGGDGPWNQDGGQTVFPSAGYPAGSHLLNVGRLTNRTYSVNASGNLQLASFESSDGTVTARDLFSGIVNLQAYYGLDTNADGVIDSFTATTPTGNAGWRQVVAVRLALVARSGQLEKEDVTNADPSWDVGSSVPVAGSASCGSSKCVTLKVSHLADWKRYRYRIYDVIVPVRNMLWHA